MAVGPESILAAVRGIVSRQHRPETSKKAAARIEAMARDAVPELGEFFLDPTSRAGWYRERRGRIGPDRASEAGVSTIG